MPIAIVDSVAAVLHITLLEISFYRPNALAALD